MSFELYQVDAFTSTPFRGNPAAVCFCAEGADAVWMQDVAREMNLSETAFLMPREDGFHLRWFTPAIEVELCGHATLASAHALWESGRLERHLPARFHTRSGLLVAERRDDWIELDFPARTFAPVPAPDALLDALFGPAASSATPPATRGAVQPEAILPGEGQSAAVQPVAGQAAMAQPVAGQAAAVHPAAGQAAMAQPAAGQAATIQPGEGQPATVQPVAGQAATIQPVAGHPAEVQPVVGQAATIQTVATEAVAAGPHTQLQAGNRPPRAGRDDGQPAQSPTAARFVGKFGNDYLIEVASEAEVRAARPDQALLGRCCRAVILTAPADPGPYDFVSRYFAPGSGIPEDPVTGAAHCGLGPFWGPRLGKQEMLAYQASARGGIVRLRLAGDRIKLQGQAVTVFKGNLLV